MSHPSRPTSTKTRAPPLRIKRRPTPPGKAETHQRDRRILLALVCLRLFNAFTINTFFQPDEYYQSLEPAWKLIFGYGEVTWEWKEAIRGVLFPGLFACMWGMAKLVGVREADTLVISLVTMLMFRLRCPRF
jgi:GPI mannosyltransferase 3